MAAAPADFRPIEESTAKIKKTDDGSSPEIRLTQNPDILAGLAADRPNDHIVVVGFAAETGDESGTVMTPRAGQAGPQAVRPAGRQRCRRRGGVRLAGDRGRRTRR